jgi:hypothetical protein
MPVANATASPPEEPPGVSLGFHGFTVAPCNALSVWNRKAKSGKLVRATGMAPAERGRATTVASAAATLSRKAATPAVVGLPATSRFSLTVNDSRGTARGECLVGGRRCGHCLVHQSHGDGVDRRVLRFDPGQMCGDDLSTAELLSRYSPARSSAFSLHISLVIAPAGIPESSQFAAVQ